MVVKNKDLPPTEENLSTWNSNKSKNTFCFSLRSPKCLAGQTWNFAAFHKDILEIIPVNSPD